MNAIVEAERWTPIEGCAGMYSISDMGRVRSEERAIIRRGGNNYVRPQKVMRPGFGKSEYRTVRLLHADGLYRNHYVHTLVLEHFRSKRPEGMDACHGDGDRANNSAANLRWDSRAGNHADKKAHGTATVGERHPMRKLDDSTVQALRAMRATGASATELGKAFNISRVTAYRAATGRSWSHL